MKEARRRAASRAGSSPPQAAPKAKGVARNCVACGANVPPMMKVKRGMCNSCYTEAWRQQTGAAAATSGASASYGGQQAVGSGTRAAAGSKKRKWAKPLELCSKLMLVTLALHCMGVPSGWEGRPEQYVALLTTFHAFLGQLAALPLLEAAQQEVTCQACQLSLNVAAWQVGTRIQDMYCCSCQPPGSSLVCVGRHGGFAGTSLLDLTARALREPAPDHIITMGELLPHAEPIQGPPLVHKGELLLTAPQATWEGWLREFGLYDSQHSVGRMAAIIAKVRAGMYTTIHVPWRPELAASLTNPIMSLLLSVRREFDATNAALWAAANFVDRESTALLLLDFKGAGWSSFHTDRAEAWNLLYGVGDSVAAGAYAVWLLFHPAVAAAASLLWQQAGGAPGGFNSKKDDHKKGKWAAFKAAAVQKFGSRVKVVHQKPGDVVWVPPGWVHAVCNYRACVKLAWDGFNWRHMAAYAEQAHEIGAKVTATANADDYSAVASVAAAALLKFEKVA